MKFENIKVDDEFVWNRVIDTEFVKQFAELTGDNNPIHLNEEFARNSIFGQRIIHGLIDLNFLKPIYHNSDLFFKLRVVSLKHEKRIVEIETLCIVNSVIAVNGTAVVKCLN